MTRSGSSSRHPMAAEAATPGHARGHYSISEVPLISAGLGSPIISSAVGATSAKRPPVAECFAFQSVVHHDDFHVVDRVGGVRAAGGGVDHLLAVAVVGQDDRDAVLPSGPPRASRRRTRPRTSTAFTAAGSTPVWPTMSPLAKLTTIRSYCFAVDAPDHLVADAVRAHLGLLVVRADRFVATESSARSSPGNGSSR